MDANRHVLMDFLKEMEASGPEARADIAETLLAWFRRNPDELVMRALEIRIASAWTPMEFNRGWYAAAVYSPEALVASVSAVDLGARWQWAVLGGKAFGGLEGRERTPEEARLAAGAALASRGWVMAVVPFKKLPSHPVLVADPAVYGNPPYGVGTPGRARTGAFAAEVPPGSDPAGVQDILALLFGSEGAPSSPAEPRSRPSGPDPGVPRAMTSDGILGALLAHYSRHR